MPKEKFGSRFPVSLMNDLREIQATFEKRDMTYVFTKALEEYRDRNKHLLTKKNKIDGASSKNVPTDR